MSQETKKPSLGISALIALFLVAILLAQVIITGSPNIRMTLIFATAFAGLLLMVSGTSWKVIEEGILHGCAIAAIMILIGMLIPGRMFLPAYKKLGLQLRVASRTCEDSATVTSPLVPWI